MAVFKYVAISRSGTKITGDIDAENIRIARYLLYKKNMHVLSIKKRILLFNKYVVKKNSNKTDLVLITRQIATLVNASMPLDEVLDIVGKQNSKSKMIEIIQRIRVNIQEGHSFADALSPFPAVFSPLYKTMVTAGEVSGHLGLVLVRLADHIEQTQKIQRKIIQALIYPCVLVLISLSVIIILLTAVVPNIVEQFSFSETALPLSTKVLMILSYSIKENVIFIMAIGVSAVIFLNRLLKINKINVFFHRHYLSLPMLGNMFVRINTSRYLRTLTTLHSNGVTIVQAMSISNAVLTNVYIKNKLNISVKLVSEGCSLSSSLVDSGVFPPIILHMIISGERSGKVDHMLETVAGVQEEELMNQISIVMSLLEPTIIIVMAAFISFVILSILQPILEINSLVM
ncbi:type II secretion system F family protein [Yersinia pestis]|uniref:type II secretion system F family protein n=1 Tax=Yersinia pestis TaxID=632 RepID=UPI0013867853|nr:type II secretion system F family protein [Yersinia pestis]